MDPEFVKKLREEYEQCTESLNQLKRSVESIYRDGDLGKLFIERKPPSQMGASRLLAFTQALLLIVGTPDEEAEE